MSTFDGFIKELPEITVDHFTHKPHGPSPRAAFLSHIHKDHMNGLETYDSSFVYCSQATKELVLRLQTRRDRLHFADGTIERRIRTYANLNYRKDLLKPLPLNTPTWVSVGDFKIRVTLFDANHCPGSTMFLFEKDGIAVLYTGDIRAEPWWVTTLSKSPVLSQYVSGLRRLDCLYLDTTFASLNVYTRDFPDRASAIQELIKKMHLYPQDTIFHFNAWTLGYEDLWVAVAAAFGVKIHVDNYRYELFGNIKTPGMWMWGPFLFGHTDMCRRLPGVADHTYEGHLTQNPDTTFHSCDSLGPCPVRDNANVVQIIPVTTHTFSIDKEKIAPRAAGVVDIKSHCEMELTNEKRKSDEALQSRSKRGKMTALKEPGHTLLPRRDDWWVRASSMNRPPIVSSSGEPLSYYIRVPLSRHSSLNELRSLVQLFGPKDLCPCVEDPQKLTYLDLEGCFGDICDLSQCTYLKKEVNKESGVDVDAAVQIMLNERWGYDDISEDELDENSSSCYSETQDHVATSPRNQTYRSLAVAGPDENSGETTEDEATNQNESVEGPQNLRSDGSIISSSQESTTVLHRDSTIANHDMIQLYLEHIAKGGNVRLKSVGTIDDDILL